jgi:ABC-type bacteriocin/lantibiotic exporter with double-glycine peptidase domain
MDPRAYTPSETAKMCLEGGRIVEHGSHEKLIAQNQHYRQLHDLKPDRHEAEKLT